MATEPCQDDNEGNLVLTTNKKALPNSPSQFPSSVKDKIRNITQRIKGEIEKSSKNGQKEKE